MKRFFALFLTLAAFAAFALPLSVFSGCMTPAERTKYQLDAIYDGGNTLSGKLVADVYNPTSEDWTDLRFNLWGNAYREGAAKKPLSSAYSSQAFYKGASFGGITLTSIVGGQSFSLCGEDENILCVVLDSPLFPDQRARIEIEFTLTLAFVNHRTGVTAHTVNLGNFCPILCARTSEGWAEYPYYDCGDPFLSDCADFRVNLQLPPDYIAATGAEVVDERTYGDVKRLSLALDNARDFALVLSDEYKVLKTDCGGKQIRYYYYLSSEDEAQKRLNLAAQALSFFSELFGEYAYSAFALAQTGFCLGGMEYPALAMLSDAADGEGADYTAVHEIAHQWWYAAVGSDQVNCAWQDEGLAEYSSLMFFEKHPEYGLTRTAMIGGAVKAYRGYYSVYNQLFGGANTAMNRALCEFSGEYEYANIAYNKGEIMFESVRASLGDEKFIAALRGYYKDYKFGFAPYEALIAECEKQGNIEEIFNSFIEGKIII